MTDSGIVRSTLEPVIHNLADGVLDAHTHLSGSQSKESPENILECMDACGLEKAFIFAPELDLQTRLLTDEHLGDIRTHNDYCADICSATPQRLLGFCSPNLKVDLSFGPLGDWQLETWQPVLNNVPPEMPCYASDVFWPCEPEEYREKYLQPQLGLFESATTREDIVEEGDLRRERLRDMIFENAYSHWQAAVSEPQYPHPAPEPVQTPRARREHAHI